jgi:hypothetical protein
VNYYDILLAIKQKLVDLDIFKSIKIGLEKGIGAKDSPFARIVPERNEREGGYENFTFQVVYGFDIKNKDLEKLYDKYYEFEEKIKEALMYQIPQCFFLETITDEDMLQNLKSAIMRFEIRAIR